MPGTTQNRFEQYKSDYSVYGTHAAFDKYRNEFREKDSQPRGTIHVMWHPATDSASLAEYGEDIDRVYFAIVYDATNIEYGDIITVDGDDCEVVSIKRYNTHRRVDIRRKKAESNGRD